jgi:2-keto-4-pentenoate hydratase/2-oxohepta-3-ene-1,7-dioic acid hydratase in catechol pathway
MKFGRAVVDGSNLSGVIEDTMFCPFEGDLFGTYRPTGRRVPLDEVTLLSPTMPHRTLVVLGGFVQPGVQPRTAGELPRFAPKLVTEVSGDGGIICVPHYVTPPIWGEVELAAIVGHDLRNASLAEAREAIFGYTCFNDVTAPEFLRQPSGKDYFSAKCVETFASMGPWIETGLTEEDLARGLAMRAWVNGEQRVEASTADLKFGAAEIVSTASRTIALRPGDVISFGTPQWCALHPGDDFELEIECIGKLRNSVTTAAIS